VRSGQTAPFGYVAQRSSQPTYRLACAIEQVLTVLISREVFEIGQLLNEENAAENRISCGNGGWLQ
jgi:hypothetical protein